MKQDSGVSASELAPVKTWLDSASWINEHRHKKRLCEAAPASKDIASHQAQGDALQSEQEDDYRSQQPYESMPFVPPLNFALVARGGIYRSGHPNERNFSFLQNLRLKSVMYLGMEDYRKNMKDFCEAQGIQVFHFRLKVAKEPFDEMDEDVVAEALSTVLDRRNLPMLIHCNKGKYRVGCLVGCLRKLQGWLHSSIFDEYARLAGVKIADQEFIDVFDTSKVKVDSKHMAIV